MIPQKHFYMIRHGETEANLNQIMAGSLDSPLTDMGRHQAEQARILVEQLVDKPLKIIHSPLSRALDTAAIINKNLQLPMLADPDLAEIHVGELEGATYEECLDMWDNWTDPPGGETHNEFFDRVRRAKNRALSQPGPVLLVCHGGVFRALWKMHGINMAGVRNAHLHEFHPLPEKKKFPWQVHVYDYAEDIIRSPADYGEEAG